MGECQSNGQMVTEWDAFSGMNPAPPTSQLFRHLNSSCQGVYEAGEVEKNSSLPVRAGCCGRMVGQIRPS